MLHVQRCVQYVVQTSIPDPRHPDPRDLILDVTGIGMMISSLFDCNFVNSMIRDCEHIKV